MPYLTAQSFSFSPKQTLFGRWYLEKEKAWILSFEE